MQFSGRFARISLLFLCWSFLLPNLFAGEVAETPTKRQSVPPNSTSSTQSLPALGRRILIGGWELGFIAVIGVDGKEEWRIKTNYGVISAWLLDDGAVIYSNSNLGVREVRRDSSAKTGCVDVWVRPAGGNNKGDEKGKIECDGCQPLPDGHILISENHDRRVDIIEIERGTMVEKFHLSIANPSFGGAHSLSRMVRKTRQGTYLFTRMGKEGYEYDATGKLLKTFPDVGFALQQMPDGTYLGSGGDCHCIISFDADGKELWRIRKDDIPGFTLGFVAGVSLLEDGSLLVANWGGHTPEAQRPALGPCIGRISADHKTLIGGYRTTPANKICTVQVFPN